MRLERPFRAALRLETRAERTTRIALQQQRFAERTTRATFRFARTSKRLQHGALRFEMQAARQQPRTEAARAEDALRAVTQQALRKRTAPTWCQPAKQTATPTYLRRPVRSANIVERTVDATGTA